MLSKLMYIMNSRYAWPIPFREEARRPPLVTDVRKQIKSIEPSCPRRARVTEATQVTEQSDPCLLHTLVRTLCRSICSSPIDQTNIEKPITFCNHQIPDVPITQNTVCLRSGSRKQSPCSSDCFYVVTLGCFHGLLVRHLFAHVTEGPLHLVHNEN